MSLDVQPSQSMEEEPNLEPTMLDSEQAADEEIVRRTDGLDGPPRRAGVGPRAADLGRCAAGVRLARNSSDEHCRLRLAWTGVRQPDAGRGFEGSDRAVWFFNHLVFEAKMMTIFSMLFGAGLVLMNERAGSRGASLRGVYYRRVLWLLVIGAIHAYLIWDGDILFLYAECGLFLYLFRNKTPRTLIILGVTLMMLIVPLVLGLGAAIDGMKAITARVDAQVKAGEPPSKLDKRIHDIWTDSLQKELKPDPAQKLKSWNEEMAAYRGGYLGIVKHRAFDVLMGQTVGSLLGGFCSQVLGCSWEWGS